jgi:hemerythrin-like metal-binding protein
VSHVQWNDTMSVGVEEIDEQHKSLLVMLNDLYDASDGRNIVIVSDTIEKMKSYARMHFSTEERYMKRSRYPELFDHMAEHAFFVSSIKDFKQGDQDEASRLPTVLNFLRQWLLDHIMVVDARMGVHLRQHPQPAPNGAA